MGDEKKTFAVKRNVLHTTHVCCCLQKKRDSLERKKILVDVCKKKTMDSLEKKTLVDVC